MGCGVGMTATGCCPKCGKAVPDCEETRQDIISLFGTDAICQCVHEEKVKKFPILSRARWLGVANLCVCSTHPKWGSYRKKPIVVRARLLDEDTMIDTLEGRMLGRKGDYLIVGVNGEEYPCKPDIFNKTYERVETRFVRCEEKARRIERNTCPQCGREVVWFGRYSFHQCDPRIERPEGDK